MRRCIFCLEPTNNEPDEHIVPESLVGDRPFSYKFRGPHGSRTIPAVPLVLDQDEVCGACNKGVLAKLDGYLQKQLGVFKAWMNPIGNKRGRPVKVIRPGLFATNIDGHPHLVLNASDKKTVTRDGIIVPPTDGGVMSIKIHPFREEGGAVAFTFTQPMRINKRFVRALHKIAFEMLCLSQHEADPERLLDPAYNPIRDYVLKGRGRRCILVDVTPTPLDRLRVTTVKITSAGDPLASYGDISLGGLQFKVDLTPDNCLLTDLDELLWKELGWMRWWDSSGG